MARSKGRVFRQSYTARGPGGKLVRKQSRDWWVQYYENGRRVFAKIGPNKEKAQEALHQRLALKELKRVQRVGVATNHIKLETLRDEYLAEAKLRLKPRTVQSYREALKAILGDLTAVFVEDLTPADIWQYSAARLSDTKSPPTKPQSATRSRSLLTREQLGQRFNVSARSVDVWVSCGCPCMKKKTGHGGRPRHWFDPRAVEDWRTATGMAGNGVSARTVNIHVGTLKAMLNWASRSNLIAGNPLSEVKPVKQEQKAYRRALMDDEVAALRDKPAKRYQKYWPIWKTFLLTGMRLTELVELRWHDVDFEQGLITVRPEVSKNGKGRLLPIAKSLQAMLEGIRAKAPDTAPTDHVFVNRDGRSLSPDTRRCPMPFQRYS